MSPITYYKSHDKKHLEQVASGANTNLAYLQQLCRGHRSPSIKLAKRLVRATEGLVSLEEWLPELKDDVA